MNLTRKKVLIRGPVLSLSGYGVHARQIARWALNRIDFDLDFQILPWGETPWLINEKAENRLIGKILERTGGPRGKYDLTFQVQLPNEWDPTLGHKNFGITAGVETDRSNPEWVSHANRMSTVIVPSQHTLDSLQFSNKLTTQSLIIPESFPDEILNQTGQDLNVQFSTKFNFLIVAQLTGTTPMMDRKNIFYTIRWLCEVFKDDPDVGIVIKTNLGQNTKIDRKLTNDLMNQLIKEVRPTQFPRIHLIHGTMTSGEMASLYRHSSIKALVNLTHGEGFCLPMLEAAASNLPVITVPWSGHMEFMKLGRFIEIDYKIDNVAAEKIDGNIFVQGSRWSYASETDFKTKVKKFRNASLIPAGWANELGEKIRDKFNFHSIAKKYSNLVDQ